MNSRYSKLTFCLNSSDNDESRDNREQIREEVEEQSAADVNVREDTISNHGDSNANDNSSDNNSNSNVQRSQTIYSENGNRNEMNIFDRFMDTILGANRNRVQSPMTIPIISGPGGDTTAVTSSVTDASNSAPESVSGSTNPNALSTSTDSNGGAIIITVNYVFSDENNPQNPNRSGSLVMTLPNNSSNRDPRIIQEFIRLATQMAYSTIVNLNKEKGIAIDKFNSFDIKTLEELKETSKECSICFEDYIAFSNSNDKKRSVAEGSKSHVDTFIKKRKLNNNNAEYTSNSSSSSSSLPAASTSASSTSSSSDPDTSSPKYLSEFTGTFEHLPIQMPCGHIFGKSCLFEWLKNHSSCPLCRDSVSESTTSETSTTEGNNNAQNNPNIAMVHRPALLDIFNSFSRDRGSSLPVRRILRSGNGLGENNSPHSHMHTQSIPLQLVDSQDGSQGGEPENQSGVFSHLLNYLRRSQLSENSDPLFPTGVSSRRTTNGVETRLTDRIGSEDNVLEFMNLRSLVDDNRSNSVTNDTMDGDNNSGNRNDNGNDNNNNTSNNDDEN